MVVLLSLFIRVGEITGEEVFLTLVLPSVILLFAYLICFVFVLVFVGEIHRVAGY